MFSLQADDDVIICLWLESYWCFTQYISMPPSIRYLYPRLPFIKISNENSGKQSFSNCQFCRAACGPCYAWTLMELWDPILTDIWYHQSDAHWFHNWLNFGQCDSVIRWITILLFLHMGTALFEEALSAWTWLETQISVLLLIVFCSVLYFLLHILHFNRWMTKLTDLFITFIYYSRVFPVTCLTTIYP